MEKTGNNKKNMTLTVMSVVFAAALLCSCSGGKNTQSVEAESAKSSAEQTEVEPISNAGAEENGESEKTVKRTVQLDLSEEENEGTVLDFGDESIFGGIEVETDENGELICMDNGSTLWYKITDSRFGSYSKFTRFVKKNMDSGKSTEFLSQADAYFITKDGCLYFVNGAGGRTISSSKRYVMSGGSMIRMSFTHTSECRKKYGISHSSVDFVKSDGTWKLNAIHNA